MDDVVKEVIDSLPVKGGARIGVIIMCGLALVTYQKIDTIDQKLDRINEKYIALAQQVDDDADDIGIIKGQLESVKK